MSTAAAWVQAIGSVSAILVAVWISYRERRIRSESEAEKNKEIQAAVSFEVANLAHDVTQFLARTSATDQSKKPRYLVDEAEYNELLERMSWVRRTATNGKDLEDARTLRSNLVETTALFRLNAEWVRSIPKVETDDMTRWQSECAEISWRRADERGRYSRLS